MAVAAVLLAGACQPWGHPRGTAANTDDNPYEQRLTPDTVAGLSLRWSAPGTEAVVASGGVLVGYAAAAGQVAAFDLDGGAACAGAPVPVCQPSWVADGRPVVATDDTVYAVVATAGAGAAGSQAVVTSNRIVAYDLHGATGCSGDPVACTPVWSTTALPHVHEVRVAGGRLYASVSTDEGILVEGWADAATSCPGGCTPAFATQPKTGPGTSSGHFAVGEGLLFAIGPGGKLGAYDAAGTLSCDASTPRRCVPRWQYQESWPFDTTPVVGGGRVYLPYGEPVLYPGYVPYHALVGFPSRPGLAQCTSDGCPRTWTGVLPTPGKRVGDRLTLRGDRIHVGLYDPAFDTLDVFTYATSGAGCSPSGAGVACQRLWRTDAVEHSDQVATLEDGALSAGGLLWIEDDGGLSAFPTVSGSSCSGYPPVCPPVWSTAAAHDPRLVADGWVAAGSTAVPGAMVVYGLG